MKKVICLLVVLSLCLSFNLVRIPAHPDGNSGGIRTVNREHPDTLSMVLILQ